MTNSRAKGANAEREVISLLRDLLGDLPGLKRNLEQYRAKGYDFTVADLACEVKRGERFLSAWIFQADNQSAEKLPVLIWRKNGERWRFMPIMDLHEFAEFVRERL